METGQFENSQKVLFNCDLLETIGLFLSFKEKKNLVKTCKAFLKILTKQKHLKGKVGEKKKIVVFMIKDRKIINYETRGIINHVHSTDKNVVFINQYEGVQKTYNAKKGYGWGRLIDLEWIQIVHWSYHNYIQLFSSQNCKEIVHFGGQQRGEITKINTEGSIKIYGSQDTLSYNICLNSDFNCRWTVRESYFKVGYKIRASLARHKFKNRLTSKIMLNFHSGYLKTKAKTKTKTKTKTYFQNKITDYFGCKRKRENRKNISRKKQRIFY